MLDEVWGRSCVSSCGVAESGLFALLLEIGFAGAEVGSGVGAERWVICTHFELA